MSEIAIHVASLSKKYMISHANGRHDTLRDLIANYGAQIVNALRRTRHGNPSAKIQKTEAFWALRDVSFEVKRGEVVGIVGRNGAGKSTLLRILSRITEPTKGRGEIYGRVGSLLEVGTGFHPELTGRENIYLNGAILGMQKAEIRRKFDEIVAFSEIERFIDTPVKHYSSGMYVRLAFAVAAHLDPEILIVDEVLAVGDQSFQKKCLNKIQTVGEQGRTVVFVSHNMQAITRFCQRVIWLEQGRIVADGPAHQVASAYLHSGCGTGGSREWLDPVTRPGSSAARLCAVRVRSKESRVVSTVDIRVPVGVEMEYEVLKPGHVMLPNFHFYCEDGVCAFVTLDQDLYWRRRTRPVGRYVSTVWIPGHFLSEGGMVVTIGLTTLDPYLIHFYEREAVAFQVVDKMDGDSVRGDYIGHFPGVVRPKLEWHTEFRPLTSEGTQSAVETSSGAGGEHG